MIPLFSAARRPCAGGVDAVAVQVQGGGWVVAGANHLRDPARRQFVDDVQSCGGQQPGEQGVLLPPGRDESGDLPAGGLHAGGCGGPVDGDGEERLVPVRAAAQVPGQVAVGVGQAELLRLGGEVGVA